MMSVAQRPSLSQGPQSHRDVFVVRLWRNSTQGSWRGQIVHVASGQTISFDSGEQFLEYIQERLRAQEGKETARSGLK